MRALDPLWFKRQIRDCSQSKENETRKSSSMKEQYPGYQRFFLACGDFSGSATTKVCERRYLGAFQASEGKRQASEERPTCATGEGAERWKSTNNSHERQSFSRGSLKIETGNPAWEVSATQGKDRVGKKASPLWKRLKQREKHLTVGILLRNRSYNRVLPTFSKLIKSYILWFSFILGSNLY